MPDLKLYYRAIVIKKKMHGTGIATDKYTNGIELRPRNEPTHLWSLDL